MLIKLASFESDLVKEAGWLGDAGRGILSKVKGLGASQASKFENAVAPSMSHVKSFVTNAERKFEPLGAVAKKRATLLEANAANRAERIAERHATPGHVTTIPQIRNDLHNTGQRMDALQARWSQRSQPGILAKAPRPEASSFKGHEVNDFLSDMSARPSTSVFGQKPQPSTQGLMTGVKKFFGGSAPSGASAGMLSGARF